jgi:hypothetical protein
MCFHIFSRLAAARSGLADPAGWARLHAVHHRFPITPPTRS